MGVIRFLVICAFIFIAMNTTKKNRIVKKPVMTVPPVPPVPDSPDGQMGMAFDDREDAHGCVGGSMPHDHAEGESKEEHDEHVRAARRREMAEALEQEQDARQTDDRRAKLREAVVMAEVLGRPRAYRSYRR